MSQRRALVIGCSTSAGYEELEGARLDAKEMTACLSDPNIGGFDVTTKFDLDSTQFRLVTEHFFASLKRGDLGLFYFAGHGTVGFEREFFFVTSDTVADRSQLGATAVGAEFLHNVLRRSPCQSQILILDCCSAAAIGYQEAEGWEPQDIIGGSPGDMTDRYILTSSRPLESAWEAAIGPDDDARGWFTRALTHGINSRLEGDNTLLTSRREITVDALFRFVRNWLRDKGHRSQTPRQLATTESGEHLVIAWPADSPTLDQPSTSREPSASWPPPTPKTDSDPPPPAGPKSAQAQPPPPVPSADRQPPRLQTHLVNVDDRGVRTLLSEVDPMARVMARLFDVLVWLVLLTGVGVFMALALIASSQTDTDPSVTVAPFEPWQIGLLESTLWMVIGLYEAATVGITGRGFGKAAVSLRVLRLDGQRALFRDGLKRSSPLFVFATLTVLEMGLLGTIALSRLVMVISFLVGTAQVALRNRPFWDTLADTTVFRRTESV